MNTPKLRGWYGVLLAGVLTGAVASAQDIHFSHLAAVPTQTNPAYTGLMAGRARVGVDYRSQWNNFTNGYTTASLSADMKAYRNRHDVAGLGLVVNSDQAGDLGFTTQQVALSTSYLKGLDNGKTYLAFGIQNVFNFQRLDWSQAVAFDYEPLGEFSPGGRRNYWDIGAGVAYFMRVNRRLAWYAGAAGAHLNAPHVTFLRDDGADGEQVIPKWTLHAGGEIGFGRHNSVRPSAIMLYQWPFRQMKLGAFYRFKTDRGTASRDQVAVHFGTHVRSNLSSERVNVDALIFAVRFDYEATSITASFDTNVSTLLPASRGVGGPELSIVQEFDWGSPRKRRHAVKCPTFQY